jgi:phosphatidate cytidylyltransferase
MAYVSGRLTGRHIIWPRISPGKTWEGVVGGLVFVMGLAFIIAQYVRDLSTVEWCILGLITAIAGTVGDFLESWLKRGAGVKDSGNILPGHGGVLDRIDSLLLSAPFITLYLYLVL